MKTPTQFCKMLLPLIFLFLSGFTYAQVIENPYNFNDLEMANLDGQDDWHTILHNTGTYDFIVDFTAGGLVSPDGSLAAFYDGGGPGFGRTATRKATSNFDFDFTQGGIVELEFDMHRSYWGVFFGAGFDADGDGHIAPGLPTELNDGGIYVNAASQDPAKNKLVLPNGQSHIFSIDNADWCRYKMILDFTANDGEGAVALFFKPGAVGDEWIPVNEIQGVNMGMAPGSGNKQDYEVWDGIFMHTTGETGGFDNIMIRQPENTGLLQFIELTPIPNKLTTDPGFNLQASATSGLPVVFEITEGPATINGNTVTLNGEAGLVTVKASQPGDDTWAAAPNVYQTFEVVDPQEYTADLTIRRPANNTNVYMSELSEIILVASAYIDHTDVLHIENVEYVIEGESVNAEKWASGYNTGVWTPPAYGTYSMTVNVTSTGNVTTSSTISFEVSSNTTNMLVPAFDGVELHFDHQTDTAEFIFPTYAGAFNQITSLLDVTCPPGGCEPWDRVGYMEVRGPTGEWIEMFRYITPYGVECNHELDATDYASILQGLVEMRFHIEIWENGLVIDVDFDFQAGEPEYKYSWVDVIWRGTFPFGDYADLQPMDTINWNYPENAEASRLKVINTGHGWGDLNTSNAAEFYEATHKIKANDDAFDQHLWVVCSPNPDGCQPQNGTWFHNRAGWCPGSISYVYDYDFTPYVDMSDVEIVYEFYTGYIDYCHPNHPDCVTGVTCSDCGASFNPHYIISGNLVTYSNNLLVTSIEGEQDNDYFGVRAYPNPASGVINLSAKKLNAPFAANVKVMNPTGQVVDEFIWDGKTEQIDVSSWQAGVYFFGITSGKQSEIIRVIIYHN